MTGVATGSQRRRTATWSAGLAAASVGGFAVGWNTTNIGAGGEALARAYGVPTEALGWLLTALLITHVAIQLPAGRLADRVGPRAVVLSGLVLIVVGSAVALSAPQFVIAILARALTGVGTAMTFIGSSDYVRALGAGPRGQGLFGAINLGGSAAALGMVPALSDLLSWRAPYLSALVLGVVGLVLMARQPAVAAGNARRWPSSAVFRDPLVHRAAVMHTASFGLSLVVGSWSVVLIEAHTSMTAAAAAPIASLTLLGGIVTRPLGGWLAEHRAGRLRVLVAASLVLGAGGTATLAVATAAPLLVLGAAAVGLAGGLPFAPAFGAAARARPEMPGSALAVVNMSAGAVALCLAPIVGATLSTDGHVSLGFIIVAVLWVGGIASVAGPGGAAIGRALAGRGPTVTQPRTAQAISDAIS